MVIALLSQREYRRSSVRNIRLSEPPAKVVTAQFPTGAGLLRLTKGGLLPDQADGARTSGIPLWH